MRTFLRFSLTFLSLAFFLIFRFTKKLPILDFILCHNENLENIKVSKFLFYVDDFSLDERSNNFCITKKCDYYILLLELLCV